MRRLIPVIIAAVVAASATAQTVDNALGLYFNDSEFTFDNTNLTVQPGYAFVSYVVLRNATGSVISGYEVGIASTAPDLMVVIATGPNGWTNVGTGFNQRVHYLLPVPVAASGTVLATVILWTSSTSYEEISFGPATPPSLPGDRPVVDFGGGYLQLCNYPFGSAVVARLNDEPVTDAATSWSRVKALFE